MAYDDATLLWYGQHRKEVFLAGLLAGISLCGWLQILGVI